MRLLTVLMLVSSYWAYGYQIASGKLTGTVVDLEGNGIEGAVVVVTRADDPDYQRELTTNAKGTFLLGGLKSGELNIDVTAEGYEPRQLTVIQQQNVNEQRVLMLKPGQELTSVENTQPINGVVTDTAGKPLEGVELTVTFEGFPGYAATVTTGPNGAFTARGLPFTTVQLYARKEDYRDQIFQAPMGNTEYIIEAGSFSMQTMEEYYKEAGIEPPKPKSARDIATEIYNQGVGPYQDKKWAEAEKFLAQAYEQDPTWEVPLRPLIATNWEQKDFKDLLKYCEAYLELHPEDTQIIELAAEAARQTKDQKKLSQYRELLKASRPVTVDTLWEDAVGYLNKNMDEEATGVLKQILEMDPKFARAYYELGKINMREGEIDAGLVQFKTALKYTKKDDPLHGEITDMILALSE